MLRILLTNQDLSNIQMLFLSLLNGILIKLLDDFLDMKIVENTLVIQSIKTAIISITSLISYNDVIYGLISVIALLQSYTTNGVDNEYWKTLAIGPLLGIILSYNQFFTSFSWIQIGLFLYVISVFILSDYFDTKYLIDEVSYSKLYVRCGIFIFLLIHYFSNVFRETKGVNTFVMSIIGYEITSCLVQVYMLFIKPKDNERSQKENN